MLALADPVFDETVKRLAREFAGLLSLGTVAIVVRSSRHDLDSCPRCALPELVERLARQRLIDVLPAPTVASAH